MSNPVMNRLDKQWESEAQQRAAQYPYQNMGQGGAPAQPGYPMQQGYQAQDGNAGQYQGHAPAYDPQAYQQLQQGYAAPSADAVDRGRMTFDDVIMKTAILLAVVVASGAVSWFLTGANREMMSISPLTAGLVGIGSIGALVLVLVNSFSRTIRPALIVAYAVAEGLMLGAISAVMEMLVPGVVIQAVVATVVVFVVTLLLFMSGKIRNSPKLMRFTLIGLIGLLASRLVLFGLSALGVIGNAQDAYAISFAGFTVPLSLLVSVIAVILGVFCLIGDFDAAKVGVEQGVPTKYSWMCAFGLMVTIVWLYVEILKIFARFGSSD